MSILQEIILEWVAWLLGRAMVGFGMWRAHGAARINPKSGKNQGLEGCCCCTDKDEVGVGPPGCS